MAAPTTKVVKRRKVSAKPQPAAAAAVRFIDEDEDVESSWKRKLQAQADIRFGSLRGDSDGDDDLGKPEEEEEEDDEAAAIKAALAEGARWPLSLPVVSTGVTDRVAFATSSDSVHSSAQTASKKFLKPAESGWVTAGEPTAPARPAASGMSRPRIRKWRVHCP